MSGNKVRRVKSSGFGKSVSRNPKYDLIVATRNKGKVREIKKVLREMNFRIYSLNDFSDVPNVNEDGKSFAENALKKARFYSSYFGKLAIADDSGLEVGVLKGLPGIYSARYVREEASDQENNQKLLKEMAGIPLSKRGARFRCALAVVSRNGNEAVVEGACSGRIGFRQVGKRGFGYDPLFILPRYGKTMAQLPLVEKNKISHRGKALRKIRKIIKAYRD